jgi:hypothetical protein
VRVCEGCLLARNLFVMELFCKLKQFSDIIRATWYLDNWNFFQVEKHISIPNISTSWMKRRSCEIQIDIGSKIFFLLYNYENLCSCLHKYLLAYLFSMYNYYVTTFSYYGLYTFTNYGKTFKNQFFNSF